MRVVFCLLVAVLSTLTLAWTDVANAASEESMAQPAGTFPKLTASNLEKQALKLPEDFAGERNLLLIAFQREQQKNVDTWLQEMKRFDWAPDFRYYELPTIDKLNPVARWFINSGMRRGIPDRDARARTITLYLDKSSFRKVLNLPDEKQIYAVLIDRSGHVLWRAAGDFDEAKAASLEMALSRNIDGPR